MPPILIMTIILYTDINTNNKIPYNLRINICIRNETLLKFDSDIQWGFPSERISFGNVKGSNRHKL